MYKSLEEKRSKDKQNEDDLTTGATSETIASANTTDSADHSTPADCISTTDIALSEAGANLNWLGSTGAQSSSQEASQNSAQIGTQLRTDIKQNTKIDQTHSSKEEHNNKQSCGSEGVNSAPADHAQMYTQKYAHGGDVWALADRLNVKPTEIKDFSTCVSSSFPNDIAPVLLDFTLLGMLPEPYSKSFAKKYIETKGANVDGLTADNILLTSGTTEAISSLCKIYANKNVSVLQPTYLDYERYAILNGSRISYINEKEIHNLHKVECDLLFICNPNNPTGKQFSSNAIKYIADQNPNTLVVVDESYMPFAEDKDSLEKVAHKVSNIVVLSSFSKVFGVPGLRIGYTIGSAHTIAKLKESISPWSVNTPAQQVALKLLSLGYTSFEAIDYKARNEFFKQLSDLSPHIVPLPSKAHFFLCKLGDDFMTSTELANICAENKVLIRDCNNINSLGDRYIRISLHKDWKLLVDLLKKIIADEGYRK